MICVAQDDEIDEGMTIGLLGGSGKGFEMTPDEGVSGYWAHLHYEIHLNGEAINPWDASNKQPHDPTKWISKTGPHLSPSAYNNSAGGFDLLSSMFNQWVEDTKKTNQGTSSSNSGGSSEPASMPKAPVSPVNTVTPMPITPTPVDPSGGGDIPAPTDPGGGGTVTPPVLIPCGIDC